MQEAYNHIIASFRSAEAADFRDSEFVSAPVRLWLAGKCAGQKHVDRAKCARDNCLVQR